jgi:preprotein translocase subunit YajC
MILNGLRAILADAAPAAAPGAQPQGGPPPWANIVPFLLLMVIMILVLVGPQRKKQKELAKLMSSMKPGDKVVTGSGIVGIIVSIKDKTVTIRSADTKIEVQKNAVAEITERGGSGGGES